MDVVGDLPVILMEINPQTGSIVKSYIHANGQILAQHDGGQAGERYFYLHDRLGSVRQIINSSGSVVNFYTYEPFGRCFAAECTETTENPFRFTGQWYDSEIGEYYLRARQYNPTIARFTARDPVFGSLEKPLMLHRYLYCGNDPSNRLDPRGMAYEWGEYWNSHFTYDETQAVIDDALELVGTNRVLGPWRAFGAGGPYRHGIYDFKDTGNTFEISESYVMTGSEFTNWLTGYTCYYHYGYYGEVGARLGGHVYALSDYLGEGSDVPYDDIESRYFLGGGILMAQEQLWQENRPRQMMGIWTLFNAKWDVYSGGLGRMANADLTSMEFDRQLDLFLTFWHSGPPVW